MKGIVYERYRMVLQKRLGSVCSLFGRNDESFKYAPQHGKRNKLG
jgi:hypothetical protein